MIKIIGVKKPEYVAFGDLYVGDTFVEPVRNLLCMKTSLDELKYNAISLHDGHAIIVTINDPVYTTDIEIRVKNVGMVRSSG